MSKPKITKGKCRVCKKGIILEKEKIIDFNDRPDKSIVEGTITKQKSIVIKQLYCSYCGVQYEMIPPPKKGFLFG